MPLDTTREALARVLVRVLDKIDTEQDHGLVAFRRSAEGYRWQDGAEAQGRLDLLRQLRTLLAGELTGTDPAYQPVDLDELREELAQVCGPDPDDPGHPAAGR